MRKGKLTMAKLIYSAITSLDGYVADEDGNFDWSGAPPLPHPDLRRPKRCPDV
jgi:hypothetical protein